MAVPITNFGLVTVSTTYGAGDTSIALTAGHGERLPATTGGYRYHLTWWDSSTYPHPADDPNKEIVLVTARSGDTLTVTRGQESTSASTKNTGSVTYRMNLGITKTMWEEARVVKSTHQGVVLQTHRNSTSEKSVVELTACDYIVMNDGTVLRNDAGEWTGKTADVTVSGAGGLDTGSEDTAVWYEIYAIAKEDATRSLLLHRSREWRIDTFNVTGQDSYQSLRAASGNTFVSQGFKPFSSTAVMYADLILKKVGAPTGILTLGIYSNSAGVPGSIIDISYALDVSRLSTSDTMVRFVFPRSATVLTGAAQYHLVLVGNYAINGTSYVQWAMDGSAGTFADGSKALHNGTSWTADADDDMIFTLGVEDNISSITLPTDYTKYCLLGWVYNDGSSNFVPFMQHGRSRYNSVLDANNSRIETLDGTIQAVNTRDFIPPLDACTALLGVGGTGTQAAVVAVGNTRATDLSITGTTTGAQTVLYSGVTSTRPCGFTDVIIERGNIILNGTSGAVVWIAGFRW